MTILIVAAILQVLYGGVQLIYVADLPGGRPYGSFQQVNVYASFLATGMLCAQWRFAVSDKKWFMLVCATALILIPTMLILVQSRTGYLGAVIGSVTLLLVFRKHNRTRNTLLLLTSGIFLGLGLLYTGPYFFPDIIPALVQKEGSTLQRWYIIRLTWLLICQHPFVGNGYGSFEALFGQLTQHIPPGLQGATIQYPHNEFLYTWMEGGIVAVLGVLAMVIGILKRLWGKGGSRWAGLALLLPIAIHMNLEYPLYQSVTHGITLVMLLSIAGPGARTVQTNNNTAPKLLGISVGLIPCAVLVFMLAGVITEVQLTRIEQQGLMPLALGEKTVIASLINPLSQNDRLDFDRHVALLLRFNLKQDSMLLTQYRVWAEGYMQVHNNPDVYNSLMMIYRAQGMPLAQGLCLRAKAMWPEDGRFECF